MIPSPLQLPIDFMNWSAWDVPQHYGAVFPQSRKTALSAPFLDASGQKFWKLALAFFGRNSLHWIKFRKIQFKYFFKDVRNIFSWLKPFSGHSIQKVQTYLGNSPVARFIKKFWAHFPRFLRLTAKLFAISSDTFFELSASKVYKNVLGAFSRFLRAKTKLLAVKSRRILELFTLQVKKMFWAHFLDFCVQKRRYLLWSSDAFWTFSACKVYRKKFRAYCQDICVRKGSGLLWSSDASWKFSPCKVTEKVLGAFSRFLRPKTKLSSVKFRRIFDVFSLHAL